MACFRKLWEDRRSGALTRVTIVDANLHLGRPGSQAIIRSAAQRRYRKSGHGSTGKVSDITSSVTTTRPRQS
jgi:hypothetical protein